MTVTHDNEAKMYSAKEYIASWRNHFGLPINGESLNDKKRLLFCLDLIQEELNELKEEVKNSNFNKMKNEYADLLFVVNGFGLETGFDDDEVVKPIYKANMSKLCNTEHDAKITVDAYLKGIHPAAIGKNIETYYEPVGTYFIIKRKDNHKVMKSIYFKKAK